MVPSIRCFLFYSRPLPRCTGLKDTCTDHCSLSVQVEEAGGLQIVHATPRKPGFDGFHSQHALQTEIIAFLKAHQGPAHLGSHIGQFVKELGAEAKVRHEGLILTSPSHGTTSCCISSSRAVVDTYRMRLAAQGRLSEYLRARPHLFHVSNQWVTLVEPQNSEQPARDSSAPRAQAGRPCCWTHADAFSTPVPLDTTRKSCEAGFVWPASHLQAGEQQVHPLALHPGSSVTLLGVLHPL